jgi:dihydroxyacetone kinase-like protein
MNEFAKSLEKIATALEGNSAKFGELDGAAGDGDLGITAGKISNGIRVAINSLSGDLKSDLATIGKEISKAASSTFGTLFATCFIRASSAASSEAGDLINLQNCLVAAFDGVSARGKAQLGERTLLDALHPAVEAIKNATDIKSGLAQAAVAARTGAAATAQMMPKHGRAGWIGERAKGLEDAGANVIAVVFESLI